MPDIRDIVKEYLEEEEGLAVFEDVVEQWLTENGYDGLAGDDCGCQVGQLMPCGHPHETECVAGHVVGQGVDARMVPGRKPEEDASDDSCLDTYQVPCKHCAVARAALLEEKT